MFCTEQSGSAGHAGQQMMIDGQIHHGGWSGLLAEAMKQYSGDTTNAAKALGQLMERFNVHNYSTSEQ